VARNFNRLASRQPVRGRPAGELKIAD